MFRSSPPLPAASWGHLKRAVSKLGLSSQSWPSQARAQIPQGLRPEHLRAARPIGTQTRCIPTLLGASREEGVQQRHPEGKDASGYLLVGRAASLTYGKILARELCPPHLRRAVTWGGWGRTQGRLLYLSRCVVTDGEWPVAAQRKQLSLPDFRGTYGLGKRTSLGASFDKLERRSGTCRRGSAMAGRPSPRCPSSPICSHPARMEVPQLTKLFTSMEIEGKGSYKGPFPGPMLPWQGR